MIGKVKLLYLFKLTTWSQAWKTWKGNSGFSRLHKPSQNSRKKSSACQTKTSRGCNSSLDFKQKWTGLSQLTHAFLPSEYPQITSLLSECGLGMFLWKCDKQLGTHLLLYFTVSITCWRGHTCTVEVTASHACICLHRPRHLLLSPSLRKTAI